MHTHRNKNSVGFYYHTNYASVSYIRKVPYTIYNFEGNFSYCVWLHTLLNNNDNLNMFISRPV